MIDVKQWGPFSKSILHVPRCSVTEWFDDRAATVLLPFVVRTRLRSFGLIRVLAFLLMASLVVSAALTVLEHYVGKLWKDATVVLGWIAAVISFGVITVLLGVICKLLPRIRLAWRDVVVGAPGTAALFELGKFVIGLYLGRSGVADSFGAAGSNHCGSAVGVLPGADPLHGRRIRPPVRAASGQPARQAGRRDRHRQEGAGHRLRKWRGYVTAK
jgi:hypothetical protein